MLADLPSVEDGNFTETPAGQAADGALEGMDVDEGERPCYPPPVSLEAGSCLQGAVCISCILHGL